MGCMVPVIFKDILDMNINWEYIWLTINSISLKDAGKNSARAKMPSWNWTSLRISNCSKTVSKDGVNCQVQSPQFVPVYLIDSKCVSTCATKWQMRSPLKKRGVCHVGVSWDSGKSQCLFPRSADKYSRVPPMKTFLFFLLRGGSN